MARLKTTCAQGNDTIIIVKCINNENCSTYKWAPMFKNGDIQAMLNYLKKGYTSIEILYEYHKAEYDNETLRTKLDDIIEGLNQGRIQEKYLENNLP
ncbi:MAG: hypothetical protein KJ674_04725 [Nanoarchaeota archaeon]|nr:hypothetical protein [Nanoarchaeota archaeon]